MKQLNKFFIALTLVALNSPVWAADTGVITISAPANGAVLTSGAGNKLQFNLSLSPNGNHVHIYVDDQAPIVDRDVSRCPCSIDLPTLASGAHTIVVKEATSSHAMTGVQSAVTVSVK